MVKIKKEYYKLQPVSNLYKEIQGKKPHRVWLYRSAYLSHLLNYWRFAVATVILFQEKLNESISETFKNDDLNNKTISASINSYNLMRICLRACKILCNNAIYSTVSDKSADELQIFRKKNSKLGQRIVSIRNRMGAHPENLENVYIGDVQWGSRGRVSFYSANLNEMKINIKRIDLNPSKDLMELGGYICKLIIHLRKCWGLDK